MFVKNLGYESDIMALYWAVSIIFFIYLGARCFRNRPCSRIHLRVCEETAFVYKKLLQEIALAYMLNNTSKHHSYIIYSVWTF